MKKFNRNDFMYEADDGIMVWDGDATGQLIANLINENVKIDFEGSTCVYNPKK